MVDQTEKRHFVAEEILEIRYQPRASFLSHMGELADYIRDREVFPFWEIDTNTINFRDAQKAPKQLHAFFSYRNAGLVAQDPPTRNFFRDKAIQYWKAIESNKHFPIPQVQRIGVRNRCFVASSLAFESLEERAYGFLCRPDVLRIMGGRRSDHQVVLETRDGNLKGRLAIGCMHKDEAQRLYKFPSPHFESTGVFIDLDTATESIESGTRGVEPFIRATCDRTWSRIEELLVAMGV